MSQLGVNFDHNVTILTVLLNITIFLSIIKRHSTDPTKQRA